MAITITIDDTPEVQEAIDHGIAEAVQLYGARAPRTREAYLLHALEKEVLHNLRASVFSQKVSRAVQLATRSPEAYAKFKEILDSAEEG